MSENENDRPQETVQNEKKDDSSWGCLVCLYLLTQIPGAIFWLVWLFQGRPDNWYGKIFRFQWKASVIFTGLLIVSGIVSAIADKIKEKKHSDEDEQ